MTAYQIYRNGYRFGSDHHNKKFLERGAEKLRAKYPKDTWEVRELGKVWIVEYVWDCKIATNVFKTEAEAKAYKDDLPEEWYKFMYRTIDTWGYLDE